MREKLEKFYKQIIDLREKKRGGKALRALFFCSVLDGKSKLFLTLIIRPKKRVKILVNKFAFLRALCYNDN